MKTLSVKISAPMAKWLLAESKQTHRSRSEIVRDALESKRNGHAGKNGRTMAEAMVDLKGKLRGPSDIATNPKYFEGYGE